MPFFHPTEDPDSEGEKTASLELFIREKRSNDSDKLSFEVWKFLQARSVLQFKSTKVLLRVRKRMKLILISSSVIKTGV